MTDITLGHIMKRRRLEIVTGKINVKRGNGRQREKKNHEV